MTDAPLSYSIILLTYNQERYVKDAVAALLAQECAPLEIFLSDDCSTDNTFAVMGEAVKGYAGPHSVVLNRNPQNLGVNRHIQRTYELCSGEVIIATSGDDICYPNRAARTMEMFERERPLLAFSHATVIDLEGEPLPATYRKALFYSTRDAMAAAKSMSLYLGATCAWHKDMFRKYGPILDPMCFEDLIHGFRAALENRVAFIDEELLQYRVGAGLTNQRFSPQSQEEYDSRRLKGIARDIAVFRQRLKDCETFGLDRNEPIFQLLTRRLEERKLREAYLRDGAAAVLRQADTSLLKRLSAIFYEAHKRRRILKKARSM
jgi:glycosyltransferase involved in cell wall biosynthesis